MATDVHNLLIEQQTGEYIPDENDQNILDILNARRPQPTLGGAAAPQFGPGFQKYLNTQLNQGRQETLGQEAALAGYGESRFDTNEFIPELDIEERRAREQSGGNKILNGLMKGGVYAVTTAVETTAGIIDGLFEGLGELGRQIATGDEFSINTALGKGVNNFTARSMANIQQLSEEWFPNYRTEEERTPEYQSQWLKHIFTPNFIGDSFLKNFGFTVGALVGGTAWSKVLNGVLKTATAGNLMKGITAAAEGNAESKAALEGVLKLVSDSTTAATIDATNVAKTIGNAAKGLNKLATKHELFGGVIAAMGEGTMEGVMARNEFMNSWGEGLKREYIDSFNASRESFVEQLKNSASPEDKNLLRITPVILPDGRTDYQYDLNEEGEKKLKEKQGELYADYIKKLGWAEEQGDRIAATTFFWNLPILTVSNTMQFGRMLSGGFKTVRSNVAKVAGNLTMKEGKVAADYAARSGSRALRTAGKALKNGMTEATEEMLQGFVSSGAQKVADARMTSFNDSGYDRRVLRDLGSWFNTMLEGGGEYLSDWKNWQEGYMGLITGLIGIPGRRLSRWNGGILGAVNEVKEEDRMSKASAEVLNSRVNTKEFADAWKGYVRHQKYETQMKDAAIKDDQYAWKTANDAQLVSDIMMFANAGRLQDLSDLVDFYANMSVEEAEGKGVAEAVTSAANETQVRNNPQVAIEKVKENAKEIKDTIQMYSDMYDAMTTLAPIGTSDDQIQEMIATAMNIKTMEKRFLSMVNDVLTAIKPQVEAVAEDTESFTKRKENVTRAQQLYDMLVRETTNTGVPISMTVQEAMDAFTSLPAIREEILATGDKNLIKKYDDLQKVAVDRRNFVKKLVTLQNIEPGKYDEKKETPEKATAKVQKENSEKTTATLKTFNDVKKQYLAQPDDKAKQNFIDTITPSAGTNKAVKEFLDFKRQYDGFLDYLKKSGGLPIEQPKNAMPVNAAMVDIVLGELFDRSYSARDLSALPSSIFRLESAFLDDQNMWQQIPGLPAMKPSSATFNALKDGIKKAMKEYLAMETQTQSTRTGSAQPADTAPAGGTIEDTPTGGDASNPGSNRPIPTKTPPPAPVQNPAPAPAPAQPQNPNPENAPEVNPIPPVVAPTEAQQVDDAMDIEQDYAPNQTDKETRQEGGKGREKIPYYRTSVPEISTVEARNARRAIQSRSKEQREAVDLSDLLVYFDNKIEEAKDAIENATNSSEKKDAQDSLKYWEHQREAFNDVWNALHDKGAFENIVSDIRTGDEVEFVIDPAFPKYKDDFQVLLRNKRTGNIYSVLSQQTSEYYGLGDLWTAIRNEYEKADPREVFVFSQTSRVWGKRAGLIDYDFGGPTKNIKDIPGYDYAKDAPVLYIRHDGSPVVVRGDKNIRIPKTLEDAEANVSGKRQGGLYLLVPVDTNAYAPVGLSTSRYTKDNRADDNPVMNGIATAIKQLVNFVRNAKEDNLEAENEGLFSKVGNLTTRVDLHDVDFKIVSRDGEVVLQVITNKQHADDTGDEPVYFRQEDITEESLGEFIASLERHLQPQLNDEGTVVNLKQFLDNELIESNVKMLRPKGMDVYIDPWVGDKFAPLPGTQAEQAQVVQTKPKEKETQQPIVSDGVYAENEDLGVEVKRGKRGRNARRQVLEDKESPVPEETKVDKGKKMASLPENQKKALQEKGYTPELFDRLAPDKQDEILKCIDVG